MSDEPNVTIIKEEGRSGGGSWLIGIVLIIALIVGVVFFMNQSNSNAAKNNAIADAAKDVGAAAQDVGDAAKQAADNATK
ncbi:hypothetical protein [Novosphingobium sp.]|uniref:hypothetical protein n=1 Tax=Novosphingobium sp. TaxID=1874826 RepID=UPI002600C45F|nr:hypothetical protein [Novosphingobium sp.]